MGPRPASGKHRGRPQNRRPHTKAMSTITYSCLAVAPFNAGSPVTLIDAQTFQPIILPAFTMVLYVIAHVQSTLSSDSPLSIGWTGTPEGYLPLSAGMTAAGLNANDWQFTLGAAGQTPSTSDQTAIIQASSTVAYGQIKIVLVTDNQANY